MQTLKISSKGQLVLPKKIRNILGGNIVSIKIGDNNQITLTGVTNLASSLSSYQKDSTLNFKEIRNKAWMENISSRNKLNGKEE